MIEKTIDLCAHNDELTFTEFADLIQKAKKELKKHNIPDSRIYSWQLVISPDIVAKKIYDDGMVETEGVPEHILETLKKNDKNDFYGQINKSLLP